MTNREIDVLIANHIFGSKVEHLGLKHGWCVDYLADKEECNDPILTNYGIDGYELKHYSTDIKAAEDILLWLSKNKNTVEISNKSAETYSWHCRLYDQSLEMLGDSCRRSTIAEAVCYAALGSLGLNI